MYSEHKFPLLIEENDLYGLAYRCPILERRVDCPLKEVDHLSFKEKVIWIQSLSKEEKAILMEFHLVCSNNR